APAWIADAHPVRRRVVERRGGEVCGGAAGKREVRKSAGAGEPLIREWSAAGCLHGKLRRPSQSDRGAFRLVDAEDEWRIAEDVDKKTVGRCLFAARGDEVDRVSRRNRIGRGGNGDRYF